MNVSCASDSPLSEFNMRGSLPSSSPDMLLVVTFYSEFGLVMMFVSTLWLFCLFVLECIRSWNIKIQRGYIFKKEGRKGLTGDVLSEVPTTQEAEPGGSQIGVQHGHSVISYLKE